MDERKQAMTFRPIGDKVLLLFPQQMREEGGVLVSGETARRMDAVVVSKGNRVSDAIRVGETVLADRRAGIHLGIDGVAYRLVPEGKIQAVRA